MVAEALSASPSLPVVQARSKAADRFEKIPQPFLAVLLSRRLECIAAEFGRSQPKAGPTAS